MLRRVVDEVDLQCETVYLRTLVSLAARHRRATDLEALRPRLAAAVARDDAAAPGPMAALAARLGLTGAQVAFLWAAVAVSTEPRLAVLLEELGGPAARRGLSVALYGEFDDRDDGRCLVEWLTTGDNPLLARGLLAVADEQTTAAVRPFVVPPRVVAHLRGRDLLDRSLAIVDGAPPALFLDEAQRRAADALREVLAAPPPDLLVVVEGPHGAGRRTAAAHAAGRPLVALDATRVDRRGADVALLELRREAFLRDALPVIANAEALVDDDAARAPLGRVLDGWDVPVVITSNVSGIDVGAERPTVRVRWPLPDAPARRALWAAYGGVHTSRLDALAHRYRVGAGAVTRAVASARTLDRGPLDAERLAAGLRHNIAERMGGFARRVEVTQAWDDIVLTEETRDQIDALVARVRHAPRVLEEWRFKEKLARGVGVAALFSGPPGTGKSMCAGLIARELDLELYQVDLARLTSKWVGETEKHLARVFDAAEEGHALLLFDEADALFGRRTSDIGGANDRYANLEINFLLQRIEAFNGITILTTNLATAIDPAFKRRLAAHIVFDPPDEEERLVLWSRLTRTATAPLADDVDLESLARTFPKMTGGNIRNAALAGAFFAAAEGQPCIAQRHLVRAGRTEYRAMGHVLAEHGRGGSIRGD